jgi:uncharacterized protein
VANGAALAWIIPKRDVDAVVSRAPPASVLAVMGTVNVLTVMAATACMAAIERRPVLSYGLADRRFLPRLAVGAGWGFAALSMLVGLLVATGHLAITGLALHGPAIAKYALAWGYVFLMVGFFEECMLRGYLQATLARGMGFWPAALVLSLVFGSVHITNPGETAFGIASTTAYGLVACYALRRFGSLWWVIGYHAAWDWAQSYFYGTPDSGLVSPGHLLASAPVGSRWWSGGTVGPEGSLFVFVALAATAVVIARTPTRSVSAVGEPQISDT